MPDKRQVLVVGKELNEQSIQQGFVRFFPQLFLLLRYIAENLSKIDQFIVFIPARNLRDLLNDPLYYPSRIRVVYVHYDDATHMNDDKNRYERDHPKLKFRHQRNLVRDLENLGTNQSLTQPEPSIRAYIPSLIFSLRQRMTFKRSATTLENSSAPKRVCTETSTRWLAPQGEPIAEKHICPWCRLILRKPYQLACGHRICESCLPEQKEWVLLV